MVFSSVVFLFRFLPLFFILYYLVPGRGKNLVLFLGSLFFYAWGEPVYVLLMLFDWTFPGKAGVEGGSVFLGADQSVGAVLF